MTGINHKHLNTFLTFYFDYQWRHPVLKGLKKEKIEIHTTQISRKNITNR